MHIIHTQTAMVNVFLLGADIIIARAGHYICIIYTTYLHLGFEPPYNGTYYIHVPDDPNKIMMQNKTNVVRQRKQTENIDSIRTAEF